MQISNFDCRSNFVLATHCVGKNCFVEYQHNFVNLITSLRSIQFIDAAVFNPITPLQPTQYPILFYSILFHSILFHSSHSIHSIPIHSNPFQSNPSHPTTLCSIQDDNTIKTTSSSPLLVLVQVFFWLPLFLQYVSQTHC